MILLREQAQSVLDKHGVGYFYDSLDKQNKQSALFGECGKQDMIKTIDFSNTLSYLSEKYFFSNSYGEVRRKADGVLVGYSSNSYKIASTTEGIEDVDN